MALQQTKNQAQLPITNCHAHIFTADHVPPWLAKTYLPLIYRVFSLRWVVALFRWWYLSKCSPQRFRFTRQGKQFKRADYRTRVWISRHMYVNLLYVVIGIITFILVLYYLVKLISRLLSPGNVLQEYKEEINTYLQTHPQWLFVNSWWFITIIFITFVVLFPSWRRFLYFILKSIFKPLAALPGKRTRELIARYLTIGRFSFRTRQWSIFSDLRAQYPPGTRFIVLPMDMEHMEAGVPPASYEKQMEDLCRMKRKKFYRDVFYPFVFADPRRMKSDPNYFNYKAVNGKVQLGECLMKKYLEDEKFDGIKIYPALGYYPFDETLLPLWKYAADKGIPVMTHCIKGVIFYRGSKQEAWDYHPIFKQAMGGNRYEKMLLPERKAMHYSLNFTHPLNYLCILNKAYLRKIVAQSSDPHLKNLFGYDQRTQLIERDLGHFKMCFGHFGGEDQWKRYMERDRESYSQMINTKPLRGVEFMVDAKRQMSKGKPEQLWKYADWYTIICSLMMQYPGVYADISYIVHDPEIFPLLKQTLTHPVLKTRVLYGTDFYVVRNHNSDRNLYAETLSRLSTPEFNQIARINPDRYLFDKPVYTPHPNDKVDEII